MLTTDLTSRALEAGLKEAGLSADLELLLERPEMGWVNVLVDGKAWEVEGVPSVIYGHPMETELLENLSISFKVNLMFSSETEASWTLSRLSGEFLEIDSAIPMNDDGSVPIGVRKEMPLIPGDELEMAQVIEAFAQFRQTVLAGLGTSVRS